MQSVNSRRDFISKLFSATVLSFTAPIVLGSLTPTLQSKGNTLSGIYTVKLSDFPNLSNLNGMVRLSISGIGKPLSTLPSNRKVILIRESLTKFNAVYEVCPHENCNVGDFNSTKMRFVCGCHGAEFDVAGVVKKTPARTNLFQFKTTFDEKANTVQIEIPNLTTDLNNSILLENNVSEVILKNGSANLTVILNEPSNLILSLYNINGVELEKNSIYYETSKVPLEIRFNQPSQSGVYFIEIKDLNNFREIRKFSVNK
ncbi:MAG: Rieske (2Fe-2S) protein [Chlorobiota bacterium]|nr:Rieske (2Fe-2S) protein [Chlorobiota bacterium]QQS67042.1 MAG: Rieske (2Fe-2S) protein [Chlorobiota bacterium]